MKLKLKLHLLLIAIIPITVAIILLFFHYDNDIYNDIPEEYHYKLDSALNIAGENSEQLKEAILKCPEEQKEAMAFLISYMPIRDLRTLKADFLLENVKYAYKAKEKFAWGKKLPKSIFFNEVLPYCSMNETRDNWRKDFFERFSKYIINTQNIFEAINIINKNIRDEVLVDYNTKREKADQSPYESMRQNMASCTGLAILLTDAFRSVCIPSRIAGTPNWYDSSGNHNWTEVWANGKWYFTEYYPIELNKCWFVSNAGQADKNSKITSIYATSFKPSQTFFPLVWDTTINYVYAENVTERYLDVYKEQQEQQLKSSEDFVKAKVSFIDKDIKDKDKRVAVTISIFDSKGQVGGGSTANTKKDLNDVLTFIVKKNNNYVLKYVYQGTNKEYKFNTKEKDVFIELTNN